MAAVPKSLGVLPPFVLQYDPSNAPVVQVVVTGVGYTSPQLYDYAQNSIEPLLEGIPGVASAAPDGGRQRQINVVVDPVMAQARDLTAADISAAVARSNALLPSGEFISPKFDANVYTNAIPTAVATIGDAPVKITGGKPVLIRDVAHVEDGGTPATQSVSVNGREAVYLNVLRIPGGNTIEIVDAVKRVVAGLRDLPAGLQVQAYFDQSTFVRTTYHGLEEGDHPGALPHRRGHPGLPPERARARSSSPAGDSALFRDHAHRPLRVGARRSTPSRSAGSPWRWGGSSTTRWWCSSRSTATSGWA